MRSKLTHIFFSITLLTYSLCCIADNKSGVVLMPIDLSEESISLEGVLGSAIQSGLNKRYHVYYGQAVESILDKEFEKIDCNTESCMLALAIEFNTSFVADAAVKQVGSGYIAKLVIRDVVDQRIIESQALPCEACNHFDLLAMLENLGAGLASQEKTQIAGLDKLITEANSLLIGLNLDSKRLERVYQLFIKAKDISETEPRVELLQQNLATIYRTMGETLADQGKKEEAKQALNRCLELEQDHETAGLVTELISGLDDREHRNKAQRLVRRAL